MGNGTGQMTMRATDAITIRNALKKFSPSVWQIAHECWAFMLSNGDDIQAAAQIDDGWVSVDASQGLSSMTQAGSAWTLLQWNGALTGGAKFALHPEQPGLRLRAELPLDDDIDLTRRLLQACAGLQDARALHSAGGNGHQADLPPDILISDELADAAAADLPALCRQTQWAFIEREPGRLVVDLHVPGRFQQATIEARTDRCVVASVPIVDAVAAGGETQSPTRRQALSLLLLRTCGIVRMVRAAAQMGDGATAARFEVAFGDAPCAAELAHGLAALSVACRLASREAAVLQRDEAMARAYVQQWERHVRRSVLDEAMELAQRAADSKTGGVQRCKAKLQ